MQPKELLDSLSDQVNAILQNYVHVQLTPTTLRIIEGHVNGYLRYRDAQSWPPPVDRDYAACLINPYKPDEVKCIVDDYVLTTTLKEIRDEHPHLLPRFWVLDNGSYQFDTETFRKEQCTFPDL